MFSNASDAKEEEVDPKTESRAPTTSSRKTAVAEQHFHREKWRS
jgi:hypothetical protein